MSRRLEAAGTGPGTTLQVVVELKGYREACKAGGVSEERSQRWGPVAVRALRQHWGITQREMADELGTRQQTVSEWETGLYQPSGISARALLRMAESADSPYRAGQRGGDKAPLSHEEPE